MSNFRTLACLLVAGGLTVCAFPIPADKTPEKKEGGPPPELTDVSGRLVYSDEKHAEGGVAYFIHQTRLMELPHENTLERVRAIAEAAVAVDSGGSFTLQMAPGNYALVYDPSAAADADNLKPGPESLAVPKKMPPEKIKERMEAIKQNAQQGLPIKDGKIADAYVIENRHVRPPVTEFGEMTLGADHSATLHAVSESGEPLDFPVVLRLRGLNGDVYIPHPLSPDKPATYRFEDLFPQRYDAFVASARTKPGSSDDDTTPTLKNQTFIFEGKSIEHKVTVLRGSATEKKGD